MRHSRNKWSFAASLAFAVFLSSSQVQAEVETIPITAGEFVSKSVSISPGYAVMFQFPHDVTALTLADQTSFSCEKMPTDLTRVLCKPLTTSAFSTNLVVSSDSNEFNIVMTTDPSGKVHPFKYVFSTGGSSGQAKGQGIVKDPTPTSGGALPLADLILDHYDTQACSQKGASDSLQFRCLDRIEIGTQSYVRFILTGKSPESVRVVKMLFSEEVLGGLTGLSISAGATLNAEFSLKNDEISREEQVYGVLKLPSTTLSESKRLSLVIMTDRGNDHDVRVYGL